MTTWAQRLGGNWACPNGRPKALPARRKAQPWFGLRRAFATRLAVVWGVKAGMTDFLSASQGHTELPALFMYSRGRLVGNSGIGSGRPKKGINGVKSAFTMRAVTVLQVAVVQLAGA